MKKKSTPAGMALAPTPAKRGRKPKSVTSDSPTFSTRSAPAAKRGAKKAAAPRVAPAPVATPPAPAKRARRLPAGKPTLLIVRHNAGWGNTLYLRGDGPGLSWLNGVALGCIGDNEWVWSATLSAPVLFKVLRNDADWSTGDNLVLAPGETLTVTPAFA